MDLVLALLVLAAAIAILAYPLYLARTQTMTLNASTLDDLLAQRDGVYATLRDLELDQQLGKLDAPDYEALREKYMLRATEILQELDALRGEGVSPLSAGVQEASAEVEREVASLRRRTADDGRKNIAETSNSLSREQRGMKRGVSSVKRETSDLRCANCGRPHNAGDQFCARCGRALS